MREKARLQLMMMWRQQRGLAQLSLLLLLGLLLLLQLLLLLLLPARPMLPPVSGDVHTGMSFLCYRIHFSQTDCTLSVHDQVDDRICTAALRLVSPDRISLRAMSDTFSPLLLLLLLQLVDSQVLKLTSDSQSHCG